MNKKKIIVIISIILVTIITIPTIVWAVDDTSENPVPIVPFDIINSTAFEIVTSNVNNRVESDEIVSTHFKMYLVQETRFVEDEPNFILDVICNQGDVVLSGGFTNQRPNDSIISSRPMDDMNGWTISVISPDENIFLFGYALCVCLIDETIDDT